MITINFGVLLAVFVIAGVTMFSIGYSANVDKTKEKLMKCCELGDKFIIKSNGVTYTISCSIVSKDLT